MRQFLSLLTLPCLCLIVGCAEAPYALALDPAFRLIRPVLARELGRGVATGRILDAGLAESREPERAPGAIVEAFLALPTDRRPPALIMSPLLAASLVTAERAGMRQEGATGFGILGGGLLVVPEFPESLALPALPGLAIIASDPVPAMERAGTALGYWIAALRSSGNPTASAALVSSADPAIGPEALVAFRAAFEAVAGFPPLSQDIPRAPGDTAPGFAAAADAMRSVLASDARVILVAAGPVSAAACEAATGPGRVVGVAGIDPEAWPRADFRLGPDEAGIARLAAAMAGSPVGEEGLAVEYIPWIIVPARSAAERRAGLEKTSLADLLRGETR